MDADKLNRVLVNSVHESKEDMGYVYLAESVEDIIAVLSSRNGRHASHSRDNISGSGYDAHETIGDLLLYSQLFVKPRTVPKYLVVR